MSDKARGPRTLKGAMVSVPDGGSPRIIEFYYNPASMKRTLQPQMVGGEEGDRSEAIRFTGAPVQVIEVEIELDAADQLDTNEQVAVKAGIYPQLAALELLVYPELNRVNTIQQQLQQGIVEIAPLTAPRTLFVWGPDRVLPVRINSYTISEELFDANLNPIQATVSLSMRVLTYMDLTQDNKEYTQFMAYWQTMLSLAKSAIVGESNSLGIDSSRF